MGSWSGISSLGQEQIPPFQGEGWEGLKWRWGEELGLGGERAEGERTVPNSLEKLLWLHCLSKPTNTKQFSPSPVMENVNR